MTDAHADIDDIRHMALDVTGADAAGIIEARPVDDTAADLYRTWIADGCHADMDYLNRYHDVRNDPRLLLDGARTMVIALFSFANPEAADAIRRAGNPYIAEYALGDDYHEVLRHRMSQFGVTLTDRYGGSFRVMVDTAPLRERYWATRAGLGVIGLNNYLIVPNRGAHFFIATLLWTGNAVGKHDTPLAGDCGRCGRCVLACPVGAISPDGRIDARRCLSYLTIESRDPLPDGMTSHGIIFGCDTCRAVCPHENTAESTSIAEFAPRKDILALDRDAWQNMTHDSFCKIFRHSAVRRAKLDKLKDTLRKLDCLNIYCEKGS